MCGCREGSGPPLRPGSVSLFPSLLRLAHTVGLRYLQIQIPDSRCYNAAALFPSLPGLAASLSLALGPFLLPCRALSGSFCNVCNGPPTPGIPRWVSNTYLHGRGTTVSVPSSADPVRTPRSIAASTTATATGTALNLSSRTTLLHYLERLIRNYYLDQTPVAEEREGGGAALWRWSDGFDLRVSKNRLSEDRGSLDLPWDRLPRRSRCPPFPFHRISIAVTQAKGRVEITSEVRVRGTGPIMVENSRGSRFRRES